MPTPRLFISYSHDSNLHKDWVRTLASRLRTAGVDVVLDQWDVDLGSDLPRFMEQVVQTDRVLLICTRNYVDRCNEGDRGGVPVERRLMSGALMEGKRPETFIPVIRNNPNCLKPRFIGAGVFHIDFNDDAEFETRFWELAASIHGERATKPPLGPNPFKIGLDMSFGSDGIQLLRGRDLTAFRVTFERDFYYVMARRKDTTVLLKVAMNGAVDESFGNAGEVMFPCLPFDPKYGDSWYDLAYSAGTIFQRSPVFDTGLGESSVDAPSTIGHPSAEAPVVALVVDDKPSCHFQVTGESTRLAVLAVKGAERVINFVDIPSEQIAKRYNHAKACSNHIYLLGKDPSGNGRRPPLSVQRFHSDGTLDTDFGTHGLVELAGGPLFAHHVTDLTELPDGRLAVVGTGNEAAISCLTPEGQPDTTFGIEGYMQFRASARSAGHRVFAHEDKIVIVGIASDNRGHNCFVGKADMTGRYDADFGVDGWITILSGMPDDFVDATVVGDTVTVLFQHDRDANVRPRIGLARVHLPTRF